LGFPRFSGVVIDVSHVLDGLVTVGIVTHVHNLHFPDFMYHAAIIADNANAAETARSPENNVLSIFMGLVVLIKYSRGERE